VCALTGWLGVWDEVTCRKGLGVQPSAGVASQLRPLRVRWGHLRCPSSLVVLAVWAVFTVWAVCVTCEGEYRLTPRVKRRKEERTKD
jgi:hypothetical protein